MVWTLNLCKYAITTYKCLLIPFWNLWCDKDWIFYWNDISTKAAKEVRTTQINEAYRKHNFCCECICRGKFWILQKNFKSSFFLQSGCFPQTFKDTNLYHLSLLLTFKAYMKNYGIEKHFPAQSAKLCGKT